MHNLDTSVPYMLQSLFTDNDWFPVILIESWWVPHVGHEMLTLSETHNVHSFNITITEFVSLGTGYGLMTGMFAKQHEHSIKVVELQENYTVYNPQKSIWHFRKWYGTIRDIMHNLDTSVPYMLQGLFTDNDWFPVILIESWWVQHVGHEMLRSFRNT